MKRRMTYSKLMSFALCASLTMFAAVGMECPPPGDEPTIPDVLPGNRAPRLIITAVNTPEGNMTAEQGDLVTINFTGEDSEDRANVSIFASTSINPDTGTMLPILVNFPVGPGEASGTAFWPTNAVAPGTYFIFGTIDDGTFDAATGEGNPPVRVTNGQPLLITPAGVAEENVPPTLTVQLPASDAGVTNNDNLTIRYTVSDPESEEDELTVTFFFDRDRNASNDATDPPIELGTQVIGPGTAANGVQIQLDEMIQIDLNEVPIRVETDEGGRPLPYFVRVEISDGVNPPVTSYAVGTVRLLRTAADVVDLQLVGGRTFGSIWQGFDGAPDDPARGSRAGSTFAPLGDFDGDGLADFAVVAETASPFNYNRVGEVYVIYGRERNLDADLAQLLPFGTGRYAGINSLNTVGSFVPFPPEDPRFRTLFNVRGHIFTGPRTLTTSFGMTSVSRMADQTGDGLPEILIGHPQNTGIRDHEDDDPCDECTFDEEIAPEFTCFNVAPRFFPNNLEAEAEYDVDGAPAGQWLPFDPAAPLMFFPPNVDFELEADRITDISSFTLQLEGQRADEMNIPFTIDFQLENDRGPMITVNINLGNFTDDDGSFMATTFFAVDDPSLPVALGEAVQPSVYDGIFTLFSRSSAQLMDFAVEVSSNAFTITPNDTAIAVRAFYPDEFPNRVSTAPNPDGGIDPDAIADFPVVCPPGNRSVAPLNLPGFGNIDGQTCQFANQFVVGCGGLANDNMPETMTSGYTFYVASDDIVTPVFTGVDADNDGVPDDGPAGVWTGAGIRRPEIERAGQPTLALETGGDFYRGARIRGAWSHPTSAINADASFVEYDPLSLHGYTVDTIADIDTVYSPDAELLVSSPAGAFDADPLAEDITMGVGGEYSHDPNLPGAVIGMSGAFDYELQFSDVDEASVRIVGTAFNAPIIRIGIDNGGGGFVPGTVREALLWGGAVPTGDDDMAPTLPPDSLLDSEIAINNEFPLPAFALPFLSAGNGIIRIEIAPECAVEYSRFEITQAELVVNASVRDVGYVRIYEGDDYSNDPLIEGRHCPTLLSLERADPETDFAAPQSWPSIRGLCPQAGFDRFLCDIAPVADITGEFFGDSLGFARNGGDLNLDGVADIAMGSPGSDNDPFNPDLNCGFEPNPLLNNGKSFIIFGTPSLGSGRPCDLPERIEVRGSHSDDQFGRVQGSAGDLNGDGNTDVFIGSEGYDADGLIGVQGSPRIDAGFCGVLFGATIFPNGANSIRPEMIGTNNFPGVKFIGGVPGARLTGSTPADTSFIATQRGQHGAASAGDFNRDGNGDILLTAPGQEWPAVKIEFNGPVADGQQVVFSTGSFATPRITTFEFDFNDSLSNATAVPVRPATTAPITAQRALIDEMTKFDAEEIGLSAITSRTQFPDPLPDTPTITALRRRYTPDAVWVTTTSPNIAVTHVIRQGVAYLIFGDNQMLLNKTFELPQDLNRRDSNNRRVLKGLVFVSAFEKNQPGNDPTPDEAPIEAVSLIGDIDGDGFVDIMLGAPQADLINIIAPSERRQAAGEAYLIYGNAFGLNNSDLP